MASSSAGASPADGSQTALVEQYKAYLADLSNVGMRYTSAQSFYFTMVSALFGVLAFKTDGGLDKTLSPTFAVVMLFVACICYVWRSTMTFYHAVFFKKLTVIKELEAKANLYPAFTREDEITEDEGQPIPVTSLSNIQAGIPVVIGIGSLILAIIALYHLASNA